MFLTQRRQSFIDEYVIDHNAAQAAIRAGYSPNGSRQTGHRLLANVDIASEVRRRSQVVARKLGVDHELVVEALLETIEWARKKQDPRAMITACKELAKVCALYPGTGSNGEEAEEATGGAEYDDLEPEAEVLNWTEQIYESL